MLITWNIIIIIIIYALWEPLFQWVSFLVFFQISWI
jgi:hypothetical protein